MGTTRRYGFIAAAAVLLLPFLAAFSSAAVTVSPSPLLVAEGQSTTVTVTYRFTGVVFGSGGPYGGTLTSASLRFLLPDSSVLATIPSPLTATIATGVGAVSESVTVPAYVVDAARRQGATAILLVRSFTNLLATTEGASARLSITSEAAASFAVKRIELYFDNRRGETTVPRNRRGLKTYADIRFVGSGLLSGYWEVDGRRILDVNRFLSFGTGVTLSTPDSPDLPTFDTGTHVVRFVVVNPAFPVGIPQALYFVTPSEDTVRQVKIGIPAAPPAEAGKGTRAFAWDRPQGIDLFLVEFSETPDGKPIFSAFARENRYAVPSEGMGGVFTPGKRYFWRVKGYDGHENQVGASAPAEFVF